MNWMPSNLGAEPKKVVLLAVIVAAAAAVFLYNRNSSEGPAPTPPIVSRAPVTASYGAGAGTGAVRPERMRAPQNAANSAAREFRPSLKIKNVEPSSIDPTLHLDRLAKLKTVAVDAGSRSLFEIGAAPPAVINEKEPPKIAIARPIFGPQPPPPVVVPPEPKPPPIPLKFYGFVNKSKVGDKRAFFLDGEDIVIAAEGDMIKKRYKIVRIGVNSAVVEDTQFKSNNQQTLPLEAELAG
ncbi:MAG TPA: hypothetical protein VKG79_13005 [Bryobacteraceae bacterium]|nr:hypothetical protein [Bryobacteraceae bacterium]